jgi:hypothetical protein
MHQAYACHTHLILVPTIETFISAKHLDTGPYHSSLLYQLIRYSMVECRLLYVSKALLVALPFHMA